MRRIRVLWVAKGLGPGGMERLLVHHARNADLGTFVYEAAFLVDRPNAVSSELEALGVRCTRLKHASGADPRWVGDLVRLTTDRRIDVVHNHSPQPASMTRLAFSAQRNGPRLVYTEHNTWDCYGATTRALNALTYPLDEAQFAVSATVRDSVPRALSRRLEPLTHGIDLEEVRRAASLRKATRASLGVGHNDVVVANIAHLRREKAQHVLLEAAARMVEQFDNVTFLSVGQGPLKRELLSLHSTLGLGDRFRFLGFRTDALALLAASDVFCLSSNQEGLPVAFMEACALGVPAVTTNVGGLSEHIEHERSGVLVAPDDPDQLSDALSKVIADGNLRKRMGRAAAAHASIFDARLALRRQETVYRRITSDKIVR